MCGLNIFWSVSELSKNKREEIETTNLTAKQGFKRTGNLVVGYSVAEWPGRRVIVDANLEVLCQMFLLVRYSCLTKLCPKKLFALSQIDVESADKEMLLI